MLVVSRPDDPERYPIDASVGYRPARYFHFLQHACVRTRVGAALLARLTTRVSHRCARAALLRAPHAYGIRGTVDRRSVPNGLLQHDVTGRVADSGRTRVSIVDMRRGSGDRQGCAEVSFSRSCIILGPDANADELTHSVIAR